MRTLLLAFAITILASTSTFASDYTVIPNYKTLPDSYVEKLKVVDDTHPFYVTTDLNIRLQPGTDSPIAGMFHRGDTVDFLCADNGWALILGTDNNFYFVCQDYLSEEKPPMYSDDDLYCLSHIINAEMGCESWEDKIYTGSVVLNRVHGDLWWSNGQRTIRAVVFRTKPLQYSPIKNGSFWNTPNEESVRAAMYLLENGSQIPSNVVYQAEFKQGKVWKKTHGAYYCYA